MNGGDALLYLTCPFAMGLMGGLELCLKLGLCLLKLWNCIFSLLVPVKRGDG